MTRSLMFIPLLLLAGCGDRTADKADSEGTAVRINADGDGGNVNVTAGKDGSKLAIKGDGVDIKIDLPDLAKMDFGSDFDIDGVHLYPGSKVSSFNVDANDKGGTDQARVSIGFSAPAAPAKAADWMAAEFAKENIRITRAGDVLTGKTGDGDDFTVRFVPAGTISKGEVVILSSKE